MGDFITKPKAKAGSERRGLSPTIFSQCPITIIKNGGFSEGFGYDTDFITFNDESPWVVTNATAGTAALDDAKGGVLLLDSASTTSGQGVQMQLGGATGAESFIASADSKIYFEARIKLADIGSTTVQAFLGLSEVDTTVIASGANSSANHIGFEFIDDTDVDLKSEKAGTRSASDSLGTIVDDTYMKLGFIVDGVTKITPYIDGVAGTAITTNIPIVEMTPTFVCQTSGTTDPIMHVDWVACYQVERIAN